MGKKYELTNDTREYYDHTLHRIRALKDFGDVKRGIRLDKNDTKYLVKAIGENGLILTKICRMRIAM